MPGHGNKSLLKNPGQIQLLNFTCLTAIARPAENYVFKLAFGKKSPASLVSGLTLRRMCESWSSWR